MHRRLKCKVIFERALSSAITYLCPLRYYDGYCRYVRFETVSVISIGKLFSSKSLPVLANTNTVAFLNRFGFVSFRALNFTVLKRNIEKYCPFLNMAGFPETRGTDGNINQLF
jgi:hypothetical protein